MYPAGPRSEKDSVSEAHQQLKNYRPDLWTERAPHNNKPITVYKIIRERRRKVDRGSQMGN
jgi:hypothetical protein